MYAIFFVACGKCVAWQRWRLTIYNGVEQIESAFRLVLEEQIRNRLGTD
jgi:hypothetical protein